MALASFNSSPSPSTTAAVLHALPFPPLLSDFGPFIVPVWSLYFHFEPLPSLPVLFSPASLRFLVPSMMSLTWPLGLPIIRLSPRYCPLSLPTQPVALHFSSCGAFRLAPGSSRPSYRGSASQLCARVPTRLGRLGRLAKVCASDARYSLLQRVRVQRGLACNFARFLPRFRYQHNTRSTRYLGVPCRVPSSLPCQGPVNRCADDPRKPLSK